MVLLEASLQLLSLGLSGLIIAVSRMEKGEQFASTEPNILKPISKPGSFENRDGNPTLCSPRRHLALPSRNRHSQWGHTDSRFQYGLQHWTREISLHQLLGMLLLPILDAVTSG